MSITPILRELIAAGLSGDALCAAVERIEAARLPVRSSNAERQQRYRDRQSGIDPVTRNVTDVTDVTDVTPVSLGSDGSPKIISNPSFPPQPSPSAPSGADEVGPVKPSRPKVDVPDWVPPEPWANFVAMRRASRAAFTVNAAKLILTELEKLKDAGEPPGDVLDQSTRNGWRDVFAIKDRQRNGNRVSMGRNDRLPPERPTESSNPRILAGIANRNRILAEQADHDARNAA